MKIKVNEKDVKKLFIIILSILFFQSLIQEIDYGLPYFQNGDENAFIKSTLYFFGFFTHANQTLTDPIYGPFFNFILSGLIAFLYNFFITSLTFSDFQNFIFLNPDKFLLFSRLSSLIVATLSLFVLFLIYKKLKIKTIIFYLSLISISLSPIFIDVGIIAGKNIYVLFLYLIQIYFFLKFFLKIEKFNIYSYLIFGLLASFSWGLNYWCALPSIYAIIFLHFIKYKYKNLNYFLIWGFTFFCIGFLPNFLLSSTNPFAHLLDYETIGTIYPDSNNKISIYFFEFYNAIRYIFITEKISILLVILILSFFLITKKNFKSISLHKEIIFVFFIFILEPIILIALAEGSYPQFRYFITSIIILNIALAYILDRIYTNISKRWEIFFSSFLIIIFSITYFNKINIHYKFNEVISKKYNQYTLFENFKNENVLYIFSNMLIRENKKNILFYQELINSEFIVIDTNADGRNSKSELEKKIKLLDKYEKKSIYPNSNNIIILDSAYKITDYKKFSDYISNKFDLLVIQNDISTPSFNPIIQSFINKKKSFKKIDNPNNLLTARSLLQKILNKKSDINNTIVGPSIYLFELN